MNPDISFGKLIKQHRHAHDLTQAELARRVGCATITIRKIEADTLRPSVQIAERLAMALNIPLEERAAEGLPKFDKLTFLLIEQGENSERLLTGECDVLTLDASWASWSPENMQILLQLAAAGQVQVHTGPSHVWEHLDFGIVPHAYDDGYQLTDRPDFFGDPRTRQAFARCIDRRYLSQVISGINLLTDTYIPPDHPLANPDVFPIEYNPGTGMALLNAIGWLDADDDPGTPRTAKGIPNVPDGTSFIVRYWTTTSTIRQHASEILAESLAGCGITLELAYFGAGELYGDEDANNPFGMVFSRAFDLVQFAWLTKVQPPCDYYLTEGIPGPTEALNPDGSPKHVHGWEGWNNTGYSNPAFDAACDAATQALPGEPNYQTSHYQAQAIFAQDLPILSLYFRRRATAVRPNMCGYGVDATTSELWMLETLDYGEGCE